MGWSERLGGGGMERKPRLKFTDLENRTPGFEPMQTDFKGLPR